MNIIIKKSSKKSVAYLYIKDFRFECLVGKNGIGNKRREGDFLTPIGIFKIIKIFYRNDKIGKVKTRIKSEIISKKHLWNTNSKSKGYNNICTMPSRNGYEQLFRKDDLYDLVLVLNYNIKPSIKFKGSAIFIHCSGNNNFTEGCISLKRVDLLKILKFLSPYTLVKIT